MPAASINAYAFIDGAYLRTMAEVAEQRPYDPRILAFKLGLKAGPFGTESTMISRTLYFDAAPDQVEDTRPELIEYWDAVERIDDTHLVFGWLRGQSSR